MDANFSQIGDHKDGRVRTRRADSRPCGPPLEAGPLELLPWVGVIALQILTAGAAWISLGATLGRGARRLGHPDLVMRAGAVTLVAVTGLVWLHSFLSA